MRARNPRPEKPANCPICASPYMALFDVHRVASGQLEVDVFVCMDCRSLSSPFAPPNPPTTQISWHRSVFDRNLDYADELFDVVKDHLSTPASILDIGCGTGTLLFAARRRGISGVGFDLDADACDYGRLLHGLDLRGEAWNPSIEVGKISLITCVMVLEHIHEPRALMADMMKAATAQKCPIFVSVPFVERAWWRYLLTEPNKSQGEFHPFRMPHVHVSHFSREGMTKAFTQFGAKRFIDPKHRSWPGLLIFPTD